MEALEYGPSKKQLNRELAIALAAVVVCAALIVPDYTKSLFMDVEPPSSPPGDPGVWRILATVAFGIFAARALTLIARLWRPYPSLTADAAGITFHTGRKTAHLVEWANVTGIEARRHEKQLFMRLRVLAVSLTPTAIKTCPRPSLLDRSFNDDFRIDGNQVLLIAHNISPSIDAIQAEIETRRAAAKVLETEIEVPADSTE
ncbi:MAG: hypothetical protein ACKVH0_09200 [Alphaproteobacteria bacterium]